MVSESHFKVISCIRKAIFAHVKFTSLYIEKRQGIASKAGFLHIHLILPFKNTFDVMRNPCNRSVWSRCRSRSRNISSYCLNFIDYSSVVTVSGVWKNLYTQGVSLEYRADVEIRPYTIKVSMRHLSSKWVVLVRNEKIHHTLLTFLRPTEAALSDDIALRVYSVRKDKKEVGRR